MSFLKRVGLATGILIEDDRAEVSRGAPPDLDALLNDEERARLEAQLDAELEAPRMPPVTTPQPALDPPVHVAPSGASITAITPEAIVAIVDEELAIAAVPAWSLWQTLDRQFMLMAPDSTQRARFIVGAMQAGHNLTVGHVLWDLRECREGIAAIRAEVEGGRDTNIEAQVAGLEQSVAAKRAEAEDLAARVRALRQEATAEEAEARMRRRTITEAVDASLTHLSSVNDELIAAEAFVRAQHPDATPEEPPGNQPPQ